MGKGREGRTKEAQQAAVKGGREIGEGNGTLGKKFIDLHMTVYLALYTFVHITQGVLCRDMYMYI